MKVKDLRPGMTFVSINEEFIGTDIVIGVTNDLTRCIVITRMRTYPDGGSIIDDLHGEDKDTVYVSSYWKRVA